jgi:hypothetical protein
VKAIPFGVLHFFLNVKYTKPNIGYNCYVCVSVTAPLDGNILKNNYFKTMEIYCRL